MLFGQEATYDTLINVKARSLTMFIRRASFLFSFPIKYRASLSMEASLVLPLFLFYMMSLLYTLEIVRFQSDVAEALREEAIRTGFAAYGECYGGFIRIDDEKIEQKIKDYLGEQFLPYLCIAGEDMGVSVQVDRHVMGKDNRRLQVNYTIKPFISIIPIDNNTVTDFVMVHDWTGYQKEEWNGTDISGIYVFITPTGKKYHFADDCTYLRVKLRAVNKDNVQDFRNGNGEIYSPCKECGKNFNNIVYLTEWGDCYHSKAGCQSIKRNVQMIPLSKVGNRTACSKCK